MENNITSSLEGLNALVCGSTSGIGRAAAIELAELGANITLFGRSLEKLEALILQLSVSDMQKHNHLVGDFNNPEEIKHIISENIDIGEPLHILINNSGGPKGGPIIDADILGRHPFPGPGLGIRILGDVTPEKVRILQEADHIFIRALKESALYDKVWQAGVMFLPVQSVGVMGDERTYENAVVLRAVESTDGMTADWVHLPYEFLAKVSNDIINKVKGVNRVVYDISSKPPATIEWE